MVGEEYMCMCGDQNEHWHRYINMYDEAFANECTISFNNNLSGLKFVFILGIEIIVCQTNVSICVQQ